MHAPVLPSSDGHSKPYSVRGTIRCDVKTKMEKEYLVKINIGVAVKALSFGFNIE